MIEINGLTDRQKEIADMLWVAETMDQVNNIVEFFGPDGQIVSDMLIAATYDDIEETTQAAELLKKFTNH